MDYNIEQLLTAARALRAIGAEADAEEAEARAAEIRAAGAW